MSGRQWVAGWRAALRLARRDVVRAKGRSALVIALIGLPVLLLGVVDIAYRSYQLDPADTLTRAIGTADVGLQWTGLPNVRQGYAGWLSDNTSSGGRSTTPQTARQIAALLPAGSRVIEWRIADDPLTFRTKAGLAQAGLVGLDYADPIARGVLHQHAGRAPRAAGEVAITTTLAAATGLGVGDVLRAEAPVRALRIVGTVTNPSDLRARTVYTLPASVAFHDPFAFFADGSGGENTWLARTTHPVTWADVSALNGHGLVVLSRPVYLHPSAAARAATARLEAERSSSRVTVVAVLTLVAGMALLEVVLLAGPAFAVGAKRKRRELALISAAGGAPRDVRRVVLANGVVLGLVAGVGAAVAAVGVAAVVLPVFWRHTSRLPGHFDVRPLELTLLAGLGLVAALAACAVPARSAARSDVLAALAGRRGSTAVRLRVPVVGALVVTAGVVLALAGSRLVGNTAALVILAGAAVTEIGLIVCLPALLAAVSRLGRRLPLAPRLALRDAGRNRSAATPAVAAVMASVIGAVSILIGVASVEQQARAHYQPTLPSRSAAVDVPAGRQVAPAVLTALRAHLPVTVAAVLHAPQQKCAAGLRDCLLTDLDVPSGSYSASDLRPVLVDDGAAADVLFRTRAAQARAALRAGRVVVTDPHLLRADGTVAVSVNRMHGFVEGNPDSGTGTYRVVRVPAVSIARGDAVLVMVVPTAVARRLGADPVAVQVFARLRRSPSDAQVQATTAALHQVFAQPDLTIESGYHSQYGTLRNALVAAAVLIAVLAAIIATALADVDGRTDLRTLGAIGAGPQTRRVLSASRSAVIAVLGTIAGVGAGFLVPAAYVLGNQRADPTGGMPFVVPWLSVLALAAAVPVIAASISLVAARAR